MEEQLDPGVSEDERIRRLEKLLDKIRYWQRRSRLAAASHCKRQRRVLKRLGIVLSRLTKCFKPFVAL